MFGKILIGFDDSEQARDAVAFAELVGREAGASSSWLEFSRRIL